jgi:hypothetical protein
MEKSDLMLLAKRWENWELGSLIHLHMRKASATANDSVRIQELNSAKIYHEVLGFKIKELEKT